MDFVDDYEHVVPKVFYFPESILTEASKHLYNEITQGCQCTDACSLDNGCSCIMKSGTFYQHINILHPTDYCIRDNNIHNSSYECNSYCHCSSKICGNRLVQYGPRKNLVVKPAPKKGLGLFTSEAIEEGNFICEYAGEVLCENEAMKRYKNNYKTNKYNYILCINEAYGENIVKTFIDPMYYGNIGRYINHSCEPNCNVFVFRVENTMPRVCFFANKEIRAGTEITYSYGEHYDGNITNANLCNCGSARCRKILPFDSSLRV